MSLDIAYDNFISVSFGSFLSSFLIDFPMIFFPEPWCETKVQRWDLLKSRTSVFFTLYNRKGQKVSKNNIFALAESYIIFSLKMESVSKNSIFGLSMMVKSGLEKIFLKFLHGGDYFHLLHNSAQHHTFSNKNNYLPAWRDFKINSSTVVCRIVRRLLILVHKLP